MKLAFLFLLFSASLSAKVVSPEDGEHTIDADILKKLKQGEIIVSSQVSTLPQEDKKAKKEQELTFKIYGLQKNSCHKTLRKLSLYESYPQFLDFVKRVEYQEKTENLLVILSASVLPTTFSLQLKMPRINKPGVYTFLFGRGIFEGLKGKIHAWEHDTECLFYTEAYWKGPDTGYSETVIELFSSTLARIAMEKLFRLSRY